MGTWFVRSACEGDYLVDSHYLTYADALVALEALLWSGVSAYIARYENGKVSVYGEVS